ncbi:hypothetical protein [Paenibacillus sp. DS2015]|uniref:hypothetical protein n=1 Tax=Paenibacillus sp. DS2015 TaxID=3373917 RepID=UPI003D1EF85E
MIKLDHYEVLLMLKSLRYILYLLPIVLGIFVYLYFQLPEQSQSDLFKTLISTVLGGLLTVFVTLNVNTYNSKQKSALERKKEIYIPITNELNQLLNQNTKKSNWSSLNKKFEFPVIDQLLESPYVFLPKKLKENLKRVTGLVEEFNKIKHYPIAKNIILNNFEHALRHCYGNKGFETYENPEEGRFHYEYPNPYKFMDHHLDELTNIDNMIVDYYENIQLYGDFLDNYKEPLIIEIPDFYDNQTTDIGEFVSAAFPYEDKIYEHKEIKLKQEIYEDIIQEITNAVNQLHVIFREINRRYEKDKY